MDFKNFDQRLPWVGGSVIAGFGFRPVKESHFWEETERCLYVCLEQFLNMSETSFLPLESVTNF